MVIDFTKGYYDIGLQALYHIETNDDQFNTFKLFTFLKPFDTQLWWLVLVSLIVVSIGVALIGRLSPYDWHQSPPDHISLWESRFQMTLFNSVWQLLTAILQQGIITFIFQFNCYMHACAQVQRRHHSQRLEEF